jgi:hypothetical protein
VCRRDVAQPRRCKIDGGVPSEKAPITRVHRRISCMMRSSGLLVRIRRHYSSGKAQYAKVSGTAVSTSSAALPSLMLWSRARLACLALGGGQVFLDVHRLEHQRDLAQLAGRPFGVAQGRHVAETLR